MNILFWVSGKSAPSPRFRFLQFVEPLRTRGHIVDFIIMDPPREYSQKKAPYFIMLISGVFITLRRIIQVLRFIDKANQYDVVFTNKDLIPNIHITFLERLLRKKNSNLIFDIDDAIYLGKRGKKLKSTLRHYKAVIAGSSVLSEYVQRVYSVPSYYVPMAIDTLKYKPATVRREGKLRIGWSGSHHTNVYALPVLEQSLKDLSKKIDFEFIIISNVDPKVKWEGVDTRFIKWTGETEVESLQLFDIGLMPLKDDEFERGKCALKAIQYMAIGIPAVVSPVGINKFIVQHGVNGFHYRTQQEFIELVLKLSTNSALLKKIGESAYKDVLNKYSVDVLVKEYERIFEEISGVTMEEKSSLKR